MVYVTLTSDKADVTIQNVAITPVNSRKAFYTLEEWKTLAGSLLTVIVYSLMH